MGEGVVFGARWFLQWRPVGSDIHMIRIPNSRIQLVAHLGERIS